MNILTINTSASKGGAAAVARIIHDAVNREDGMSSVFISGRGADADVANVVSLGVSLPRLILNVVLYRLGGGEGPLNRNKWRHILDTYYSWADVVHLHNAHGYYLPDTVLRRLLDKPVVWTLHDCWVATGRCALPTRDCPGTRRGCCPCPHPERYPSVWRSRCASRQSMREGYVAKSAIQFVAPSRASRDALIGMGLPGSRLQVVGNPLIDFSDDTAEVLRRGQVEARKVLGLPQDRRILVFIANRIDEPMKGLSILGEALAVRPQFRGWHLVIIGESRGRIRTDILRQHPETCFVGHIKDRRLLLQYLVAADCLANPSLSETFGLVNIEAAAVGCPVVCSDLPVFREYDLGVVRYHKPGDAGGLAAGLDDIYDRVPGIRANRITVSKEVVECFSVEKAIAAYVDLYHRVFSENR